MPVTKPAPIAIGLSDRVPSHRPDTRKALISISGVTTFDTNVVEIGEFPTRRSRVCYEGLDRGAEFGVGRSLEVGGATLEGLGIGC